MDRFLWFRFGVLTCLGFVVLVVWITQLIPNSLVANVFLGSREDSSFLTVAFLDVGQGDAIFVETPDGVQLLIDGGPDGAVLRELGKVMPFMDKSLDVVLATHSDKDHIGGLVDVLARYNVDTLVATESTNDTAVAETFLGAMSAETAELFYARAPQTMLLGASTTFEILSPRTDTSNWESNTASIVGQLRYGNTAFMLTGDAPLGIEEYLVSQYGNRLNSDVLKLGHHGSRTSSARDFVAAVSPEYAIASAGKDNTYGHPHEEVVKVIADFSAILLETGREGTIIFKSNGNEVWRVQ